MFVAVSEDELAFFVQVLLKRVSRATPLYAEAQQLSAEAAAAALFGVALNGVEPRKLWPLQREGQTEERERVPAVLAVDWRYRTAAARGVTHSRRRAETSRFWPSPRDRGIRIEGRRQMVREYGV